jgi:hypothetical protein
LAWRGILSSDDGAALALLGVASNETLLLEELPFRAPPAARAEGEAAPHRKGDPVECYSAADGKWAAADVVSVHNRPLADPFLR